MESHNFAILKESLNTLISQIKQNNLLQNQILMSQIITNAKIDEDDKQTLLLLLQDRDRNYLRLNHNSQVYARIQEYLEILRPLEIQRDTLVRIGGENDGGYVMYRPLLKMGGGGGRITPICRIQRQFH